MKLIPRYQKAGKLNIEWIKDKDVNGNQGYRNVKTGQFRSTLPNSTQEKAQDTAKRNKAALVTYSSQKAKFDRTQAHRKNHSDETMKKVIEVPQLVSDKKGIMSNTSTQQKAPNEDSAQIDNTFENLIVGDKLFRLGTGVGKIALSKIGNGTLAHKARNSLLNESMNNLTSSIGTPLINTPSKILNTSSTSIIEPNYLKNTYTGFKGTKPKLDHHLQGEDAVKMFKEYGGTPIPKGSINGDQLRKYVAEARERYGLMGNNNISDEEIAQALYKHTNELGKGSAAINSQGEPQLLFRGDTKPYTKLKVNHEQIGKSDTADNVLGTMFLDRTGIGEGFGPDRYMYIANQDNRVMAPYRDGIATASFDTLQPKFKSDYITPIEEKGFVADFDISYPYYKYNGRYGINSGGKISSEAFADGYTNQLNGFVVRTPHERDITNEVYTNGMGRRPKVGEEFQWRVPHTTDISSAPKETRILQNKAIVKDAQQKNQGLLRSKAGSPYRDEHDRYDYLVVPDFNARNVKHILPYDLRIPRNWSDPNIFRIAVPIGISSPFLNNSQK